MKNKMTVMPGILGDVVNGKNPWRVPEEKSAFEKTNLDFIVKILINVGFLNVAPHACSSKFWLWGLNIHLSKNENFALIQTCIFLRSYQKVDLFASNGALQNYNGSKCHVWILHVSSI